MKRRRLIALLMILVMVLATPTQSFAVKKNAKNTVAKVSTQKQLIRALNKKNVRVVKISTKKKRKFTIPSKNYSKKNIVFTAKKSSLINKGYVNSISLFSVKKFRQEGESRYITSKCKNAVIDISHETSNQPLLAAASGVTEEGVTQVNIEAKGNRVISDETVVINADERTVALLDEGAEKSEVDLNNDSLMSTVINQSEGTVNVSFGDKNANIESGDFYNNVPESGTNNKKISKGNVLKPFQGVVHCGNVVFEIFASGYMSGKSTNDRIYGWYHNKQSGTDYECEYMINGDTVRAKMIGDKDVAKNYCGDAEWAVVGSNDNALILKSINNFYGDDGTEYTLNYNQNNTKGLDEDEEDEEDSDNPLSVFRGIAGYDFVVLSINNPSMVEDFYMNQATQSKYSCKYIVNGNKVVAQSDGSNDVNYLGDAEFTIDSFDEDKVVMTSANNLYGDEGHQYTFYALKPGTPLNTTNPLYQFKMGTHDAFTGVRLELCNIGPWAEMSGGDFFRGGYHKLAGGHYSYSAMVVIEDGKTISVTPAQENLDPNYKGMAQFKITNMKAGVMAVKSNNDAYGDKNAKYEFRTDYYQIETNDDEILPTYGPAPADVQPLRIFYNYTEDCKGLELNIHAIGQWSSSSHGNKVHGWYHNKNTNTDYECRYVVNGTSIKAVKIDNNMNKNYKGDAEFEIVAFNSDCVTMVSKNNIYGDWGTEYTFYPDYSR